MEPLEDLHILAASRGRPPGRCQVPDHPVDILWGHLPRRAAQRTQHPLQQADVVVDGDRAEPASPPGGHERVHTRGLELPRIGRDRPFRDRPAAQHPQPRHHRHTFLTLESLRWHLTYGYCASKIGGHARGQIPPGPARIRQDQHVPAPDGWTKTFTDPRLCAAIVDRLTFNATIIETGTESYRLARAKAGTAKPAA